MTHEEYNDAVSEIEAFLDKGRLQKGLTRAQLARLLGGRSRVSDFFIQRRPLSLGQVEKLRGALGIPSDLLIA
ncbi:MAG: helix-turn-helix domain-containing protein [Gemmatimonadaceae bacterium]